MDRQLTVEFPWVLLTNNFGTYDLQPATDVNSITDRLVYSEAKIDLSGYIQSDLTVGFRRSFEQKGSSEFIQWAKSYDGSTDYVVETVIISSVPMNNAQITASVVGSPGFTNYGLSGLEWGNFNREHIIHGSYKLYYANSVIGSGAFSNDGTATLLPAIDNYFSSLEPTAADCLYCYRIIYAPVPGANPGDGVQNITIPPMRVILDAFTVEEPDLEYMMRLKRSYELANQV
ncbi:MAG: hypothetical protein [Circular genetic element sp.]|nr:MAG: hypothetical protein [Circular genetic element sp.]